MYDCVFLLVTYLCLSGNHSFLESFAQICSLEMSMVVEAHLDPRIELHHNTKEVTGDDIRAGGVIPHQITLVSSFLIWQERTK